MKTPENASFFYYIERHEIAEIFNVKTGLRGAVCGFCEKLFNGGIVS